MANWAHIENNEIKGRYDLLPKNWRNVSGLNLLENDLPLLKTLGWYPITKQTTSYDDVSYFVSGYEYKFENDQVLEIPILSEKQIVVVDFSLQKEQFMEALRIERNKKLSESDYTQFADVQNLLDEETKTQWLAYRQALRDIPELYSNDNTINIELVVWPEKP